MSAPLIPASGFALQTPKPSAQAEFWIAEGPKMNAKPPHNVLSFETRAGVSTRSWVLQIKNHEKTQATPMRRGISVRLR